MTAVCGAALIAVLLGIQMKAVRPEYAQYMTLAALAVMFALVWETVENVLELVGQIGDSLGVSQVYMTILLKILGITYVAELTAGICRDAGYGTLGTQLVIISKFMICAVSLPVFMALLELVTELLGG